jgi:hypothetical protein
LLVRCGHASNIKLLHVPAVPLLGINPREGKTLAHEKICT